MRKKQLEPTKLRRRGRSTKEIGVVPEILADKERLKRQSLETLFFCPNIEKTELIVHR